MHLAASNIFRNSLIRLKYIDVHRDSFRKDVLLTIIGMSIVMNFHPIIGAASLEFNHAPKLDRMNSQEYGKLYTRTQHPLIPDEKYLRFPPSITNVENARKNSKQSTLMQCFASQNRGRPFSLTVAGGNLQHSADGNILRSTTSSPHVRRSATNTSKKKGEL